MAIYEVDITYRLLVEVEADSEVDAFYGAEEDRANGVYDGQLTLLEWQATELDEEA